MIVKLTEAKAAATAAYVTSRRLMPSRPPASFMPLTGVRLPSRKGAHRCSGLRFRTHHSPQANFELAAAQDAPNIGRVSWQRFKLGKEVSQCAAGQ